MKLKLLFLLFVLCQCAENTEKSTPSKLVFKSEKATLMTGDWEMKEIYIRGAVESNDIIETDTTKFIIDKENFKNDVYSFDSKTNLLLVSGYKIAQWKKTGINQFIIEGDFPKGKNTHFIFNGLYYIRSLNMSYFRFISYVYNSNGERIMEVNYFMKRKR